MSNGTFYSDLYGSIMAFEIDARRLFGFGSDLFVFTYPPESEPTLYAGSRSAYTHALREKKRFWALEPRTKTVKAVLPGEIMEITEVQSLRLE